MKVGRKVTIAQKVLLSLAKHKKGASWRMLAGWHQRLNSSSLYATITRLRRQGLVSRDNGIFFITEEGLTKLKQRSEAGR